MFNVCKRILRGLFPEFSIRLKTHRLLISTPESYLHTSGWIESLRRGYPSNAKGKPLPWMNFPAIAIIENRLTDKLDVFEYGSGYSTLFYAALGKSVVSIEHDQTWLEKLSREIPRNAKVHFVALDKDGEYCRAIKRLGVAAAFVIVDGRDRVNCLKQSVDKHRHLWTCNCLLARRL